MANKSIKKNFIYNLIYQLMSLISPLAVTPYISRVLGVDNVGLYSYADSMSAYFVLIAVLGTATYGQRTIGYNQDDKEARSCAFWDIFLLRLLISTVTIGGYVGYAFLFGGEHRVITLVFSLNIINVIFDVTWFFQGMEEFGKIALRSIVVRFACIASIFCFVRNENDLYLYTIFMLGFNLLGNVSLWLYLPKYLVKVRGVNPFHDFKSIIMLFLPSVATQVYTVLDKSMIGWFSSGYNENGYYEQSEKIVKIALMAVTALGIVMIPRISNMYKSGNMERVRFYLYNTYRYVWMMSIPIMFGFISIANVFTPVYYGTGYEKCEILLPIFSTLLVFIGLSNVNGLQYFVPIGKENILTLTVAVGAVVNFTLNLILIPLYASLGACIASIVAEASVTITGFIYIWKTKQFPLKKVFTCSWRYWLAGGIMCAALFGLKNLMPIAVWSLIVLIFSGAAIYFVILLLLGDPFLLDLMKKGFLLLKRRNNEKVADNNSSAENANKET